MKEHENLEKEQRLKHEIEKMWRVKTKVVPVVMGKLGTVASKMVE